MKSKELLLIAGLAVAILAVAASVSHAQSAASALYVCPPCGTDCHDKTYDSPGKCPVCNMELVNANAMKNVAIFLYEGVELLDFSGPGEVFAASRNFSVFTVSGDGKPLVSQGFLNIQPDYSISNAPKPDIIILPGGNTGPSIQNKEVIEWVLRNSSDQQTLLSVCTGAFILAKAGLLDGKKATTWYGAIDRFKTFAPKTEVLESTRFVDNGNIITTAGVSAGIDGALHLVSKIHGMDEAKRVARYMEYDKWVPENGMIVKK